MPHDPPQDPPPEPPLAPIRTASAFPATAPLHAEPTCARILEAVHRQLSINEPWTHRTPDGFSWWPGGSVRQHLRAEGPIDVDGFDIWWLTRETPVWRNANAAALASHVEALRIAAHGAAVVHDAATGRTSLVTLTYLPTDLRRLSRRTPLLVPPHGTGCCRYVSTLRVVDELVAFWQQGQADGTQPLVAHRMPWARVVELLSSA